jgi:cytidine deaminase
MTPTSYDKLSNVEQLALSEAEKALSNVYSPYSHFKVAACLYTQEGKLVSGVNCEDASYGLATCAERTAIVNANTMGLRKFSGIAIITKGENFDTQEPTAPCGSCRQMLYELSQLSDCDLKVIMSNTKKDKILVATISELLPYAFGPKDLGIDLTAYSK